MVAVEEGLTVQLTPDGAPILLWVERKGLDQIVVRGNSDGAFDYQVNGLRRGFEKHQPLRPNRTFVPRFAAEPWGAFLPEELRQDLVRSGVLNSDFTPNEATAALLGRELIQRSKVSAEEQEERRKAIERSINERPLTPDERREVLSSTSQRPQRIGAPGD